MHFCNVCVIVWHEVIYVTTGERMKERRKVLGISAEYVAEKLGVSPATIYRYEKGDIEKMPGTILEPISKILCTTPAYLMGWSDQSVSPEPAPAFVLTADEKQLVYDYRDASKEIREEAAGMLHRSAERNRKDTSLMTHSAG